MLAAYIRLPLDWCVSMKYCKKCDTEKPLSEFHKNKSKSDGLTSNCKTCVSDQYQKWYSENSAMKNQYSRDWYACHPSYREDNAARLKSYQEKYYQENRDKKLQEQRDRYASDPEERLRRLEYARRYRKNNPMHNRVCKARRRAREKNAGGTFNDSDIMRILKLQRNKCAYCKIKINKEDRSSFHADHIEPLAKGGSNGSDNIQILCPSCNKKKSDIDPIDFANRIGFLL